MAERGQEIKKPRIQEAAIGQRLSCFDSVFSPQSFWVRLVGEPIASAS